MASCLMTHSCTGSNFPSFARPSTVVTCDPTPWEPAAQDPEEALRILNQVKHGFIGHGPDDAFPPTSWPQRANGCKQREHLWNGMFCRVITSRPRSAATASPR